MFDYSKLIGRIIEKFGTRKAFAKAAGYSENTISKKLSGKIPITTNDITEWTSSILLDIPYSDIPEYFFKLKVQEDWTMQFERDWKNFNKHHANNFKHQKERNWSHADTGGSIQRNKNIQLSKYDYTCIYSRSFRCGKETKNETVGKGNGSIIEIVWKEKRSMTTGVQITLIICATLILLSLISRKGK